MKIFIKLSWTPHQSSAETIKKKQQEKTFQPSFNESSCKILAASSAPWEKKIASLISKKEEKNKVIQVL
jgi:hypothetical protein